MAQVELSSALKFRTRESCVVYFSNILADYDIGDVIARRDAEDLTALARYHANSAQLIGPGVAYFQKVKASRMNHFGEFAIARVDRTAVALSYSEASLGGGFRPAIKPRNKGFLERPIGLTETLIWIPIFSPLK